MKTPKNLDNILKFPSFKIEFYYQTRDIFRVGEGLPHSIMAQFRFFWIFHIIIFSTKFSKITPSFKASP